MASMSTLSIPLCYLSSNEKPEDPDINTQNLQNCVEAHVESESLFDDGNEHIDRHCNPYLRLNCIVRCTIEGFDTEILFDPLEK